MQLSIHEACLICPSVPAYSVLHPSNSKFLEKPYYWGSPFSHTHLDKLPFSKQLSGGWWSWDYLVVKRHPALESEQWKKHSLLQCLCECVEGRQEEGYTYLVLALWKKVHLRGEWGMLSFMEAHSFWALGTRKTSLCNSWYHWAARAALVMFQVFSGLPVTPSVNHRIVIAKRTNSPFLLSSKRKGNTSCFLPSVLAELSIRKPT